MIRSVCAFLALSFLAGCGVSGALERPGPLWGSEEAIAREQAQTEEDRLEAERRRQGQAEPGETSPTIPPLPQ